MQERYSSLLLLPSARCILPAALLLLTACGTPVTQTLLTHRDTFDPNYISFEHDFTDAAEAEARRRAAAQCALKKRTAVETSRACSLSRCTVSFQCMTADEAAAYAGGARKP